MLLSCLSWNYCLYLWRCQREWKCTWLCRLLIISFIISFFTLSFSLNLSHSIVHTIYVVVLLTYFLHFRSIFSSLGFASLQLHWQLSCKNYNTSVQDSYKNCRILYNRRCFRAVNSVECSSKILSINFRNNTTWSNRAARFLQRKVLTCHWNWIWRV